MKKTMYKLSAFLMALAISGSLYAQVPQKFNYQGIARDAKGNPMGGKTLSLKLSVLPTSDASAAEYEEVQTVSTNEFGLYTLQIGNGQSLTGDMKSVKWETGNKYIRVAIDPQGGSNYVDAGTTQLLSVPYAIYADKAGMAKTSAGDRTGTVSSNAAHVAGDANFITKFTALNVIGKSRLFDNGTSIGLGTSSPIASSSMHIRRTTSGQYLYMENPDTIGFGSFRLYNDDVTKFATFTKYGSKTTGGYTGISSLYPFANMLGYGNNGPFLNAGAGNIGFAITKAGTNKLKMHIDWAAERVGFGGNAVPQAQIHFNNTDAGNDTVKFTNQTTGHTAADGTELRFNGNATRLINRENSALILGTNNTDRIAIGGSGNVGIGTTSPTTMLDVNGQIRMQGGAPGAGKLMVSDASGIGSWSTAAAAGLVSGSGTTNYVPMFSPNGNTLSNSQIKDSSDGLMYNATSLPDSYTGMYINLPAGKSALNMHTPTGAFFHNYFNLTSNSTNPWQAIHMADSARYFKWYLLGGTGDSVGSLYFNKTDNFLFLGSAYGDKGLRMQVNTGRMGNVADNAHFAINSAYDTAGNFTSSSSNFIGNGILRSEWTGPFGTLYNDNRAIYGKSKVRNNYGYGVFGEGGYYGVYGLTDSFGSAAVGGYGTGSASGVSGGSDAGSGLYGYSFGTGNGISAMAGSGMGLNAYSSIGRAVYASTDSNQVGLFMNTRSTANPALINGVLRGEYNGPVTGADYIGVYGRSNMGSTLWGIGVKGESGWYGVYGTATSYGVRGEGNYGVYGWGSAGSTTTRYGVYGTATGATTNYAGYFNGTLYATTGTFGTKPFMIDHPLDPTNKFLRHSSIESNDMMNMYNGNITTDANGYATVQMPDYFEALNENFKYQLTVIGTFAQAIVKEEISNNRFVIQTNQPNVKVSWQVTGVRHDAVAKKYPVVVEELKPEGQKGKYLEPEAFGMPAEMGANRPDAVSKEQAAAVPAHDFKAEAERVRAENINKLNEIKANDASHKQHEVEGAKNWKQQEAPKTKSFEKGTSPSIR